MNISSVTIDRMAVIFYVIVEVKLGGAVPNNQKYFCSPIPMKLWDMMENVFIKM
jgi:hypothetical protein